MRGSGKGYSKMPTEKVKQDPDTRILSLIASSLVYGTTLSVGKITRSNISNM